MYFSAICIIFCAFYIRSACCGLITKKSQISEACPPGIWTCSTGKRSEIAKVNDISQTVQRRAVRSYPPGIWTRDELEESEQLTDKKDPERFFPRMFVHKNEKMLKQMLKRAMRTSQQNSGLVAKGNPSNSCPPGVWTCSTGKRSEITNKGQVEVLDESSSNNVVKEQNSPRLERRRATNSCPPGMWVCDQKLMRVFTRELFKLRA